MELRHLRYFLALAEEGSFGRAAARLHISQPPLTRQIRQLESRLGADLFLRTAKGVELTDAGRLLLDEAANIMALVKRADERTRLAGKGELGRLDIGIFGSAIFRLIPQMLARFRQRHPAIRVSLHPMTKTEQIDALLERRLSIGFNRLVPEVRELVIEKVLEEDLVVALPAGHPLVADDAVALEAVLDEPLIVYPSRPRPSFADDVVALFRRRGVEPRVDHDVQDLPTAIALVSGGFGVCVAPASAASLLLPDVVYRPLKADPKPTIELCCIYRRDEVSPVLDAFLAIVREFGRSV